MSPFAVASASPQWHLPKELFFRAGERREKNASQNLFLNLHSPCLGTDPPPQLTPLDLERSRARSANTSRLCAIPDRRNRNISQLACRIVDALLRNGQVRALFSVLVRVHYSSLLHASLFVVLLLLSFLASFLEQSRATPQMRARWR